MPKELTHFALAEEGRKKIVTTLPGAAEILQRNFTLFMVGSIICDSAYYQFPLLSKYKNISHLSEAIHLPKGDLDTAFLTRLLKADFPGDEEGYLSFLSGIVSHYIVDKAYHPFVMHITGDYFDEDPARRKKAQGLHRFLESLLDLWVVRKLGHSGKDTLNVPEKKDLPFKFLKPCLNLFVKAAMPDKGDDLTLHVSKCLYSKLRFELKMSALYRMKPLRSLFPLFNRVSNNSLSHYAALFYPEETFLRLSFFEESFMFKNPLTGDKVKTSLEEITHYAIDEIAIVISEIFSNFESRGRPYGKEKTLSCFTSPIMEINPEAQIGNKEELERSFAAFLGGRRL
ncbi:MAG: zinc dependent phospholipase C family protein [Proteobacteria bacterium]|nr:zinc dependent phospholipase C family protein [Pseudomonadota bacterium]